MELIENMIFEGERPLYKSIKVEIKNSEFLAGESAIKESKKIKIENCNFHSKYPFWHNKEIEIQESFFSEDARASIWYTNDVIMNKCKVEAPKIFRDAKNIKITDTIMDTEETLWDCLNVEIINSVFKGNYLLLHAADISLSNFTLDGNYSFQHVTNGVIRNSVINSKDAFWNTENITVYDSVLNGEYLGWYSKNLTLINCKIIGTQPLCYAENLTLENCEMIDTDLCFEYATVNASITTTVDSIKNPISGIIKAKSFGEVIFDDSDLDFSKVTIVSEEV